MDNVVYSQPLRTRGGFRGRPVVVPQQQMMSRGGGRGYFVAQSGGDPLTPTPPPSKQQGEMSDYPTLGHGDFVKQLQYKIASLNHRLLCSEADTEKLVTELDKRTKALEGMNEKYAKLEEEFDAVASYALTRGGTVKVKDPEKDQHFAQQCVKLEAKIAKNKEISADKKKIKELEEKVSKLEGDKKGLEESLQKQETDLEIQRSLNTRFHGMFKMFAETASENCKEIDSFVAGLSEEGIITVQDSPAQTPTPVPMEEIGGDNSQLVGTVIYLDSSPSQRSSIVGPNRRYNSGGSSGGGGRGGHGYNDLDLEEDDMSPPPPAAFLDAINGLTEEELEELERMEMEVEKEANENK